MACSNFLGKKLPFQIDRLKTRTHIDRLVAYHRACLGVVSDNCNIAVAKAKNGKMPKWFFYNIVG